MKQPTENQLKKFENVPLVSMWIPHGYMRDLMDYERSAFFIKDGHIDYRFIFFQPPTEHLQSWVRYNYVPPSSHASLDSVRFHVSSLIEVKLPWKHYEIIRDACFGTVLINEDNRKKREEELKARLNLLTDKKGLSLNPKYEQEIIDIHKEQMKMIEEKNRSYNPCKPIT